METEKYSVLYDTYVRDRLQFQQLIAEFYDVSNSDHYKQESEEMLDFMMQSVTIHSENFHLNFQIAISLVGTREAVRTRAVQF